MRRWILGGVVVLGCGNPDAAVDGGAIDAPPADADAAQPRDGASVADAGADPCAATTWCAETSPSTTDLKGVFARTAHDVFAVGTSGTILRREHGTWTPMTSGTTADLRGVWAASATDAWAVGASGTILRWNGATWAPAGAPSTSTTFEAVWGANANNVWAVGGHTAYHYTGTWTQYGLTGTAALDVHGTASDDVWAASEGGYLKHWDGTTWTTNATNGICFDCFSIHAISATNAWVAGSTPNKQTGNFTGSAWTPYAVSATLDSLWASGPDDVWGVALHKIARWTGTAWSVESPAIITQNLRAVSGAGTYVWVVGDAGTIACWRP
jgi:hypothetical protein